MENEPRTHTLQPGDTLASLAAEYYGDPLKWRVIAKANPRRDPSRLAVGMELVIPPLDEDDATGAAVADDGE